jgi:hypothetical protein
LSVGLPCQCCCHRATSSTSHAKVSRARHHVCPTATTTSEVWVGEALALVGGTHGPGGSGARRHSVALRVASLPGHIARMSSNLRRRSDGAGPARRLRRDRVRILHVVRYSPGRVVFRRNCTRGTGDAASKLPRNLPRGEWKNQCPKKKKQGLGGVCTVRRYAPPMCCDRDQKIVLPRSTSLLNGTCCLTHETMTLLGDLNNYYATRSEYNGAGN